jgi:hypothetical protein
MIGRSGRWTGEQVEGKWKDDGGWTVRTGLLL